MSLICIALITFFKGGNAIKLFYLSRVASKFTVRFLYYGLLKLVQYLVLPELHITSCSNGLKQFARFLPSNAKKLANHFSPLAKRYMRLKRSFRARAF